MMLILPGRIDRGLCVGLCGGGREQGFLSWGNRRVRAQRVAPCGHEEERDKPGQPECQGPQDAGNLDFMPEMISLLLRHFSAGKDK